MLTTPGTLYTTCMYKNDVAVDSTEDILDCEDRRSSTLPNPLLNGRMSSTETVFLGAIALLLALPRRPRSKAYLSDQFQTQRLL